MPRDFVRPSPFFDVWEADSYRCFSLLLIDETKIYEGIYFNNRVMLLSWVVYNHM